MPSKEFNVGIKERKKQEMNAIKRSRDTIHLEKNEIPFSHLFADTELDIDSSEIFVSHNIEKTMADETEIRISDKEVYNASYLMMPELIQRGTSVKQVVPKEVSDKINNLFEDSKSLRMYMYLKLYLNGFTLDEIADIFEITKSVVSPYMIKAKKRIIDNLTDEEVATCYWWLRVDKPVLPKKEVVKEVKPIVKKSVIQNHWNELEAIYNSFQGR